MRISSGVKPHARKVMIYGPQGVGKSRLASQFPKSLTLDLERGTLDFDCDRNEDPILTFRQFLDCLLWLVANVHEHKRSTIVIDSFTRLQELLHTHLAEQAGVKSIGEIGGGFGRGEKQALAEWATVKQYLDALISSGVAVVCIAHAAIAKVTEPDGSSYTSYAPDLAHTETYNPREIFVRWCDEVFLMKQENFVVKSKGAFGAEKGVNTKTNNRLLITSDTGGVCAKHRLGVDAMPPEIQADVSTYLAYVRAVKPTTETVSVEPETQSSDLANQLGEAFERSVQ